MADTFEGLPIIGAWLQRLSVRPERVVTLEFISRSMQPGGGYVIEFIVQFGRCLEVHLDLDGDGGFVVRDFIQEIVTQESLLPRKPSRTTVYGPSLRRATIEFGRGGIVIMANDVTSSIIRKLPL